MQPRPTIEMLIFQTTPFCNINCTYCYLPDRRLKSRLPPSIVSEAVTRIAEAKWTGRTLSIVWHAGEPLAVGAPYLESLFDACAPLNQLTLIQHYVQTNATLLNSEFCDLFKRLNVRVGVSIDGPREIHNKHRVTRSGQGTYDRVMRGIEVLRSNNVQFSVICVLTSASLGKAKELYEFFEGIGAASVGFNVDELEGINNATSMHEDGFFDRLENFWRELFKVHFERRSFVLREADTLVDALRHGSSSEVRNQQANPFSIVTVSVEGLVGTFSPELLGQRHATYDNFSIGHISADTFEDMQHHPRFLLMKSQIEAGAKKCLEQCSYFELCGGGAPSNKLFENGTFDSSRTKYCHAIKISVIDSLLAEAKRQQSVVTGPIPLPGR